MRRPRLVPTLAIIGVLSAGVFGVSRLTGSSESEVSIADNAAVIERSSVRETVAGTGTVQPIRQANLNFSTAGRVASVLVKPGMRVAAGQWLARVDAPGAAAAVADAEQREILAAAAAEAAALSTEAAGAQIDAAEARQRVAADGPTAGDRGEAAAAVRQAEEQIANAQKALDDATRAHQVTVDANTAAAAKLQGDRVLAETAVSRTATLRTQAVTKLDAARARLRAAETSAAPRITQANALPEATIEDQAAKKQALDVARADVVAATEAVNTATAELASADAGVAAATDALIKVQFEVLNQPAIAAQSVSSAATAITAAEQAVRSATANLGVVRAANAKRLEGPKASAVAEAGAGVEIARDGEASAQQSEVTAQLAVNQAAAATAGAKEVYAESLMWAPFNGVISHVNVREGELSTPSGGNSAAAAAAGTSTNSAIVLVDDSITQVRITLPEIDAAKVSAGQAVEVLFDALPDESATGTVASIDVTATSVNNVISYGVVVQLDELADAVKLGMTAAVTIVVNERDDVISVPRAAITDTDDGPALLIVVEGRNDPEVRPVSLGVKGDGLVEITDGVEVGERYVADAGGAAISTGFGV
jgi:HlyD family secretion protein